MSLFKQVQLACPGCGTNVAFDVVESVAADRRPDLREAILAGSFQREACPSCERRFRVEPELVYMDFARGQYLGAWPASRRWEWRALAAQTRANFDDALGDGAPASARKIGASMQVRAVFGWWALAEKILARQLGIDDRVLEAAKLAVMRTQEETTVPGRTELRLVETHDEDLVLAWVGGEADDERGPALRVPRGLLADIEADADTWRPLLDAVAEGDVVDFQRELLAA